MIDWDKPIEMLTESGSHFEAWLLGRSQKDTEAYVIEVRGYGDPLYVNAGGEVGYGPAKGGRIRNKTTKQVWYIRKADIDGLPMYKRPLPTSEYVKCEWEE